jgi:hypothetical protein
MTYNLVSMKMVQFAKELAIAFTNAVERVADGHYFPEGCQYLVTRTEGAVRYYLA